MADLSKKRRVQKPNKLILSRTLFLLIVCGIVAFAVLAVKLFNVMIVSHDYYEELAVEQQTKETTVKASRGTIYDRNGNVLAMSATAYTVYISPYEMQAYEEDPETIAEGLSQILGVDKNSILEKTTDTATWYKTIATKIETELADEVRAFKSQYGYKSVHIEEDTKRYYPYGSLACHVIGFVGTDGYGLYGLESVYNDYLEGTDGSVVRLTTADGTDMLYTNYEYYNDAVDGDDVTLTIDANIQYIVEKYMKQAIEDYDVQNGGSCIAMNVNTGEILAMASFDNYDLNDYLTIGDDEQAELDMITDEDEYNTALAEAQYDQWRNTAIADTYEPGSVFKIITLSMALDEGIVNEDSTFYCGGSIDVLGRDDPLHCWKTAGHGSQTLVQAVQHSCNVAFVRIGLSVGARTFYDYVQAFGFFDTTGIDLEGEASSDWWSEDVFYNEENLSQLAAASFGQTFTITPLQMITAISAAANGGYLMEPYVVSDITDSDGETVYSASASVVRQVISEETSAEVCKILEAVVGEAEGTGKNAYVAGYRVAGKTGTSEKVALDAAGGEKEYIVSFCGFAPADDPQVAILVILDTPSDETGIYISGGVMCAPVVGNIFSEILPYLGVEPEYTAEELEHVDVTMPKVTGDSVADATSELEALGLTVRLEGTGDTVTGQLPSANAEVAAGTTVVIYAGGDIPGDTVSVPDLYGMTVDEARDTLKQYGLYLDTSGASPSGADVVVSNQSVSYGTSVAYGAVIEVTLVDNSIVGRY